MKLLMRGHLDSFSGYGQLFCSLIKGVKNLGITPVVCPSFRDESFAPLPPSIKSLIPPIFPMWENDFLLHVPRSRFPSSKKTVFFTMWESTRLDPCWVGSLNKHVAVIVPSDWSVNCFSASGVLSPIHKIPLGVDTSLYSYTPPKQRDTFVFGCGGRTVYGGCRKSLKRISELFKKAFPIEKDVELRVKSLPDLGESMVDDPRVKVFTNFLPEEEMKNWFADLDCFVSLSTSEGWGFMQHKSLALGRPLISVKYGGVQEYFDERMGFELDFDYQKASGIYEGYGLWASPKEDSVIDCMRYAYNHRSESESRGRFGAQKMSKYSIEEMVRRLLPILESSGVIYRD